MNGNLKAFIVLCLCVIAIMFIGTTYDVRLEPNDMDVKRQEWIMERIDGIDKKLDEVLAILAVQFAEEIEEEETENADENTTLVGDS